MKIKLEQKVLLENDRIAQEIRGEMARQGVVCFNLISAPGAGKTTLLERLLSHLRGRLEVGVVTGDIQTENDAQRLARYGFPVFQITTGGACHLDASMVERALRHFDLPTLDLFLIENVGNLICPTSYDLGETAKIVVWSVTEGEDKALKYPTIFQRARLLVINKIDLLPYTEVSLFAVRRNALKVNPGLEIIETSCRTNHGLERWYTWMERQTKSALSDSA